MTISAKVIADSISESGARITTFELEYPRFIHSEVMTHRLFSRNAASSRAIPVKRAIELIREDTAMPIHWGKNQPGMSAREECDTHWIEFDDDGMTIVDWTRETIWERARDAAIGFAKIFDKIGYHKQIVNRLLEPFTHIKVVCTATEYDNFFHLRFHPDAQPEIQELARQMYIARGTSKPNKLIYGDWHTPYYQDGYWEADCGKDGRMFVDRHGVTLEDALAISASCCAQVSYRRLDDSMEKAKSIYNKLVEMKPMHASPFEHQATPIAVEDYKEGFLWEDLPEGCTAIDLKERGFWSGNFLNWIQYRQTINDNTCWAYHAQ